MREGCWIGRKCDGKFKVGMDRVPDQHSLCASNLPGAGSPWKGTPRLGPHFMTNLHNARLNQSSTQAPVSHDEANMLALRSPHNRHGYRPITDPPHTFSSVHNQGRFLPHHFRTLQFVGASLRSWVLGRKSQGLDESAKAAMQAVGGKAMPLYARAISD